MKVPKGRGCAEGRYILEGKVRRFRIKVGIYRLGGYLPLPISVGITYEVRCHDRSVPTRYVGVGNLPTKPVCSRYVGM